MAHHLAPLRFPILWTALAALGLAAAPAPAVEGRWTPVGPPGGGPRLIASDPLSANRLYAAFPSGPFGTLDTLLLRSEDAGATWQEANQGLEGRRIISLAADATHPGRLYAVAAVQGCFSDDPGGVYRSDDRGAHWRLLTAAADLGGTSCAQGLVVLSDAVLVGTGEGVARSTDGGSTWQILPLSPAPDSVHTLVSDPRNDRVVYAAGWQARFKSLDGGLTWTWIDDPASRLGEWVKAFALSPADPETLYAYAGDHSLWRSTDGGAHWGEERVSPTGRLLESVSLLADPRDPETLYFGTDDGLWVSRNGGLSFRRLRRGLPDMSIGRTAFPAVTGLAADTAGRIHLATGTGLWTSADSGLHWTAAPLQGVHANVVRFLRFDPFRPGRILFTSFDTLYASGNGGDTWSPLPSPPGGALQALELDPFRRNRIVALTQQLDADFQPLLSLTESRDGGRHWDAPVAVPQAHATALAIPAPDTVLVAVGNRILRRQGGSWHVRLRVQPEDDRGWFDFSRILADPSRPGTLLALGLDHHLHAGAAPKIYRSLDAGLHWSFWEEGGPAVFDATRSGRAYFADGADIYRRRIDEGTAQRIGGLRPAEWLRHLLADPRDPQTFYISTYGRGVLVSHDRARTWSPAAPGLPLGGEIPVLDLQQDPRAPRHLYATPYAGGLYRLELAAGE